MPPTPAPAAPRCLLSIPCSKIWVADPRMSRSRPLTVSLSNDNERAVSIDAACLVDVTHHASDHGARREQARDRSACQIDDGVVVSKRCSTVAVSELNVDCSRTSTSLSCRNGSGGLIAFISNHLLAPVGATRVRHLSLRCASEIYRSRVPVGTSVTVGDECQAELTNGRPSGETFDLSTTNLQLPTANFQLPTSRRTRRLGVED